jgi:F-type H+-transporting ATPase subunit epsilon
MLKLEVVTPERRVVDSEVDAVTLPTSSGEAGILPHHAPLISAISPGVMVYTAKGVSEKMAVSSGFVEVNGDKVSVLVDTAESSAEIDVDAARADREAAEKAVAAAGLVPAEEAANWREAVEHAAARLSVATGKQISK